MTTRMTAGACTTAATLLAGTATMADLGAGDEPAVCRLERGLAMEASSARPGAPTASMVAPPGVLLPGAAPLVDVLVVYTPAARGQVGGVPAMATLIDGHVAYTNDVYLASGVVHRLRLVHAAEVAYVETVNLLTDLARLRDTADGFLDDVHPLRDTWGADLVVMIGAWPSAGAGYQMQELSTDFASSAFSAMDVGGAGVVFAHETGHNMGCGHNNEPGAPAALFCYAYGHRTPSQNRTVMSNPPGDRVDFFSTPLVEFDGEPLGIDGAGCPVGAADCARTLNETAPTVAAFRPTAVPVCPGDVDDSGDVGFADLLAVLTAWGPCAECPRDVDGNGAVGFSDVLAVLSGWGPC